MFVVFSFIAPILTWFTEFMPFTAYPLRIMPAMYINLPKMAMDAGITGFHAQSTSSSFSM